MRRFKIAFQVEELSIQLIEALVPLMPRIKQRDKSLEDQLRRAASSIGLNCAEAAFSDPGNRRARLFTAAGSAGETRHALRQAVAWRLVAPSPLPLALCPEVGGSNRAGDTPRGQRDRPFLTRSTGARLEPYFNRTAAVDSVGLDRLKRNTELC